MTDLKQLESQADEAAQRGDFPRARALLETAAAAADAGPALLTKLSAMRKASGDVSGAIQALDRALALSPLDFHSLLSRALLLERSGDKRAPSEFGNALTQVPPTRKYPRRCGPRSNTPRMCGAITSCRLKSG